jgi:hypothetical protein
MSESGLLRKIVFSFFCPLVFPIVKNFAPLGQAEKYRRARTRPARVFGGAEATKRSFVITA